jgi:hypothetical protein
VKEYIVTNVLTSGVFATLSSPPYQRGVGGLLLRKPPEVFASAHASAPTPAPPEEGTDALQNLCYNAVDTTDLMDARGQVTLRVRVRRLEPALNPSLRSRAGYVKGQWYHINSFFSNFRTGILLQRTRNRKTNHRINGVRRNRKKLSAVDTYQKQEIIGVF